MNKNKIMIAFALVVVVVVQAGLGFGQSQKSDSKVAATVAVSELGPNDGLAGSWYVTLNSVTNPVPFRAMLTFSEGGGVIGSAQGDILLSPPPGVPPLATAAHGGWVRTANREYLFTFRQIYYNGDGTYAGGAKVRNAATVSKNGNEMTGDLVVQYYDATDVVVFTGTGTFTATRIGAEPLTP